MSTIDPIINHVEPYIPASKTLPEVTFRAVLLGIVLAVVLAASSTFVGLKIARTISGSIPAALISMLILRRFKNANILENNMVQTIASAGETVATGVIFILPALIILGYWQAFDYVQTMVITVIGGVLGVMFSVPLRRSMVVQDPLPYPEGIATGEVLKAGEDTKSSTHILLKASLFSAILSFCQAGLKIAGEQVGLWTKVGATAFGGTLFMSPVLTAAGYIVGMRGLIAFIVGGVLTWGIAIPLFVAKYGFPEASDLSGALTLVQKNYFRFVGVGVLAVGGLWSVLSLVKQIKAAFYISYKAMKTHKSEFALTTRTDRDLPFKYVLMGIIGISIPTFILFCTLLNSAHFQLGGVTFWSTVLFVTLFSLLVGFVAAAVAAYIVGIVGTTSLPVSGIAIGTIIAFSSIVLLFLGHSIDFSINKEAALQAMALVITFATVVCVAAAVSGDNMQDLKAGQIVGATPWKQQIMLAVGAIASALVIPLILQTTFQAYGIGDVLPRPGMDIKQALPAPQATLMAAIVKGFFGQALPWGMIQLGAVLAIFAIILDEYLKKIKSTYRFPVLLFALGIYLPLGYVTAFFVGGVIHSLVGRKFKGKTRHHETSSGILCASGIIAGEAILGALLTIPFAYYQTTDVFALKWPVITPYENLIGGVLYIALCIFLYRQGRKGS